jgi:hypothetical protein
VVVRLVLWSLADAKSSFAELHDRLPPLRPPGTWLWNEASDRFGALVVEDDDVDALADARALIGHEPDVYEEFDAV